MLWHKTWTESRTRFIIAVVLMVLACVVVVGWQNVDGVLFRGFPRTLFTLLVIVLGMGGLLHERNMGTAGFTLALPVSRTRLTLTRAVVATVEIAALALVPVVVLTGASLLAPRVHSVEPLMSAVQWVVGIAPLFGLAFFASVVLVGEYTPFVAAFAALFFETVTVQFLRLARPGTAPYLFTLQEVMNGVRPITPAIALLLAGITFCLIVAALSWVERQDF